MMQSTMSASEARVRASEARGPHIDLRLLVERLASFPTSTVQDFPGNFGKRTYLELQAAVRQITATLKGRGVEPGMRLGLVMANSFECLALDLAVLELRCVSVMLPAELLVDGLADAIERFDLHAAICDAAPASAAPWIATPSSLRALGLREPRQPASDPDFNVPAWVFSSGTTGRLRCIETYRRGIETLVSTIIETFSVGPGDHFLLFLPMHSFQQRFLLYATLWNGVNLTISSPRYLLRALSACQPTFVIAPPSLYEAFAQRINLLPRPQRAVFQLGMAIAPLLPPILRAPIRRRLATPLRAALGGRTRLLISGMAPISPHGLRVFEAVGLPITEVYGMTECGMISWNTETTRRLGSVGRPLPDAQVTLAGDGEILVRRRAQPSKRYLFEDPSLSGTYIDDHVIATGDLGRFDADGFLYIVGRKKNLLVLRTGEKLSPEPMERELQGLGGVEHALMLQDRQGIALVCSVSAGAVPEAVERTVRDLLKGRWPELALTRLVLTREPLTVENGLLTSNLKPRRDAVAARFLAPERRP